MMAHGAGGVGTRGEGSGQQAVKVKKRYLFLIALVVLAVVAVIGYRYRVELLVFAAPRVMALGSPVGPNRPIKWSPGPVEASAAPGDRPPNVVVILADDLGFNDISLANGGAADGSLATPNIDAIAANGVVFSNGYAGNAVCSPSRAALMTGRYSTRFGLEFTPIFSIGVTLFDWIQQRDDPVLKARFDHELAGEMPARPIHGMPASEVTLAETLKAAGYHTLRVYAAMIRSLDRSVGRVLDALDEHGLTDNTLVIFTSDNGGAGYVGLPDINRPYRGWKLTLFEGGIHVPFLAQWPARIEPGTRYERPVSHMDIFTTVTNAAAGEIPTDRVVDGVDLMPHLSGALTVPPREALFWRQGHHQAVRHKGLKLIVSELPARPEICLDSTRRRWLFDLHADPTEQRNIAAERPHDVAALEQLLAAHNAEQAAPMWPSVVDAPQLVDKHEREAYREGDEYVYWPN